MCNKDGGTRSWAAVNNPEIVFTIVCTIVFVYNILFFSENQWVSSLCGESSLETTWDILYWPFLFQYFGVPISIQGFICVAGNCSLGAFNSIDSGWKQCWIVDTYRFPLSRFPLSRGFTTIWWGANLKKQTKNCAFPFSDGKCWKAEKGIPEKLGWQKWNPMNCDEIARIFCGVVLCPLSIGFKIGQTVNGQGSIFVWWRVFCWIMEFLANISSEIKVLLLLPNLRFCSRSLVMNIAM